MGHRGGGRAQISRIWSGARWSPVASAPLAADDPGPVPGQFERPLLASRLFGG
jgi:hypothetical protein